MNSTLHQQPRSQGSLLPALSLALEGGSERTLGTRLRAALLSENPLEDGHLSDRFRLTEFYRVKFRNVVELWLRPPLAVIGLFKFYLRLGLKIISELEIQVLVSLMTNLHFLQWRQDVSYLGCWTICLHVGGVCYRFLSPQSCNYLKTLKQNPKIGEWGGVGGGAEGTTFTY